MSMNLSITDVYSFYNCLSDLDYDFDYDTLLVVTYVTHVKILMPMHTCFSNL
jgi:hypothetical protein